jgi:hypothetical protein
MRYIIEGEREEGRKDQMSGRFCGTGGNGNSDNSAEAVDEMREVLLLRARALYLEVMKPVGEGVRKQASLWGRLWALTDPNKVEEANMLAEWREKYKDKITVRTKSIWVARLMRNWG